MILPALNLQDTPVQSVVVLVQTNWQERQTGRETDRQAETQRQICRETEREREAGREAGKGRRRDTETKRDGVKETDRQRETMKERHERQTYVHFMTAVGGCKKLYAVLSATIG